MFEFRFVLLTTNDNFAIDSPFSSPRLDEDLPVRVDAGPAVPPNDGVLGDVVANANTAGQISCRAGDEQQKWASLPELKYSAGKNNQIKPVKYT